MIHEKPRCCGFRHSVDHPETPCPRIVQVMVIAFVSRAGKPGTDLANSRVMEAVMHERRRHPRHQPARDITGKVKSTMEFRVVDISEGGVLVETRLGLPPSTVCELKVSMFGVDFTLKAEVRRCRAQLTKTETGCKVAYHSGLEFVDVDDDRVSGIRQLISDCCAPSDTQDGAVVVTQGAVVSGSLYTV